MHFISQEYVSIVPFIIAAMRMFENKTIHYKIITAYSEPERINTWPFVWACLHPQNHKYCGTLPFEFCVFLFRSNGFDKDKQETSAYILGSFANNNFFRHPNGYLIPHKSWADRFLFGYHVVLRAWPGHLVKISLKLGGCPWIVTARIVQSPCIQDLYCEQWSSVSMYVWKDVFTST